MKLAGFRPQGVKDAFHVAGARPLAELQGCQLVFRLADQLAALVTAYVAGEFATLVDHAHLRGVGPDDHGLPAASGGTE